MSGPITPPLTVTTASGTPSGRPITTIKVSDGDLTISGNVATIDTSGSGGSPATPAKAIQFNSDPAGTFTGSSRLLFDTDSNAGRIEMSSGLAATQPEIRTMTGRGLQISSTDTDESIRNQIIVFGEADGPDGIALYPATGLYISVGDSTSTPAQITTRGAGANLVLTTNLTEDKAKITLNAGANGDVDIQTEGTGITEIQNATTDNDTTLSVKGNGTGDAKINLNNPSKAISLICDTNQKLKVQGGVNTFVFDASSATGGITFPDATELISAEGTAILATGITDGYVLTADGAGASAWEAAGGGGAATLGELTDVSMDITNFTDSLLIQTDSNGAAPTTGTLSSASDNVGIGGSVLSSLSSGSQNTIYGSSAGESLSTAWQNTLIGYGAGKVSNGYGNTAIGRRSLYNLSTGQYNTGVGDRAGYFQNSDKNIFIGHKAGYSNPGGTGDSNIVIGALSVSTSPGSGEGNVALGQGEHTSATGDNQLLISSGTAAVNWIRGDSSGSCYQGDNATTWSTTSDQRLKREIVDATVGLDAIKAVQVRNFRFIEKAEPIIEIDEDGDERIIGYDGENTYDLDPEPLRIGVIAQEVMEVFPDAVKENALGHLIVNPDSINWALLKAVQELSAKVEALEAMIE